MPDIDNMTEDDFPWDDIERRAIDEHNAQCVRGVWRNLTPEQRAMTTFHGPDFHIRKHKGRDARNDLS